MSEPQYYELHKCVDCNLIMMIRGFIYNKNFEMEILFEQPTQTTEQYWQHVKGNCRDLIRKVVIKNPDYKPS